MSGPPKSKPLDVLSLAAVGQEGFQTELEGSRRRANGTAEGAPLGIYAENYSPSVTARVSEEGEILGVRGIPEPHGQNGTP